MTEIAVSLAGIAVLVLVSWFLGALRTAKVTQEAAAERLAFDEPDFAQGDWLVGTDGISAAAVSADGAEGALVFVIGDGLGTRRFRRGGVAVERSGAILAFKTSEPSLPKVRVSAPDEATAARWVLTLAEPRL